MPELYRRPYRSHTSRTGYRSAVNSDAAAAREAGVETVVPIDIFVAFKPAPQHGFAVALAGPVKQQRREALDLCAGAGEILEIGVEARLQCLGLRQSAVAARTTVSEVGLQLGEFGPGCEERVNTGAEPGELGPRFL